MNGWTGQVLDIDLDQRRDQAIRWIWRWRASFWAGAGWARACCGTRSARTLIRFRRENVLIFAGGPLTATGYQTSNRFSVSTKSPLTGTVLDANSGGFWGMQFKKTGYDVMIVRGRADKPGLHRDQAGRRDDQRCGAPVGQARARNDQGAGPEQQQAQRVVHRPGGREPEPHGGDHERRRAQPGARRPGAVMGSKNLKAIVVEGKQRPEIAGRRTIQVHAVRDAQALARQSAHQPGAARVRHGR